MFRISTKTHGLLDYLVGGAITALPFALNCTPATRRVLHAAGWGAAAYSVLTDYERGLVKVLPMEAHLTLDALSGAGLITAAMLLDDETPENRALLAGIGVFEIAVASMTSTQPYTDGTAPNPIEHTAERIGEYV
jgi:hypothetical protein